LTIMPRERKLPVTEPASRPTPEAGEAQVRTQLRRHLLEDLWTQLEAMTGEDELARPGNLLASTTLELDSEAYEEVLEVLEETVERTLEIMLESSRRLRALPEGERDELRTRLAILHYPRADSAAAAD
jgi:hypothetical protein